MKKLLTLVLALAMLLSVCAFSASAEELVDGKFAETKHITVEIYDRNNDGGTDPTNNVYTDYIKQGMLDKHNVEVEFVSIGRWTEVDDMNTALAAGDAPDVCVTYSYPTIAKYAQMGGIVNLNDIGGKALEEYKDVLPNLWNLLGPTNNIFWDQDPTTGDLWAIEATLAENARINTFIRKDWLDKLGLALPTTEEEFYNALVAFRDNAETLLGADADKMVPYTTSTDIGWRNDLLSVSKVADDISDETLFVYGYDDRHLLYPGYKEGIRVLNKWYNEGLIWKDFGLYTDSEQEDNNMKAGYVGAFQHNWDYPFRNGDDCINLNLQRNVGEDAMFVPIDCFQDDAGITRKFMGAAVGSDRKIFFPSTNKEPLASLLYVNFISDPEVIKYLQTGEEGVNYNMTEDGAYEILPATGDWVKNSGNNIDYTMTCNGLYLGEATGKTTALSYPGIPADIVIQANEYGKNNGRYPAHYNVGTIESETEVGTSLQEKRDELFTKAVTASVEEFDAVYDGLLDEYMSLGGEDIINERIEKLQEIYGITFEK